MAAPLLKVIYSEVKCKYIYIKRLIPQVQRFQYSDWKEDEFGKKTAIGLTGYEKEAVHPETPALGEYEVTPPKGKVYDKKPFPMKLEAEKRYAWCVCGHSHTQPLCDGTHKIVFEEKRYHEPKTTMKFMPHRFRVTESKKYWLCNCKQTNNRPFCDGTHKRPDIQAKKL